MQTLSYSFLVLEKKMTNVKLLAYEREFKHVGVCTCGKQWNLPEQKVRKATEDDVKSWAKGHGWKLIPADWIGHP